MHPFLEEFCDALKIDPASIDRKKGSVRVPAEALDMTGLQSTEFTLMLMRHGITLGDKNNTDHSFRVDEPATPLNEEAAKEICDTLRTRRATGEECKAALTRLFGEGNVTYARRSYGPVMSDEMDDMYFKTDYGSVGVLDIPAEALGKLKAVSPEAMVRQLEARGVEAIQEMGHLRITLPDLVGQAHISATRFAGEPQKAVLSFLNLLADVEQEMDGSGATPFTTPTRRR